MLATTGLQTMDVLAALREEPCATDPYPLFAELREQRPVRLPAGDVVFTRYDDVTEVLRDPRFHKPVLPRPPFRAGRVLFRMFLLLDPPDHTRLRRAVAPVFSAAAISPLRPRVVGLVDELLPPHAATIDLVDDFAYPLPLAVVGELLDVPATDRVQLSRWSRALTESLDDPLPVRLRDIGRAASAVLQRRSHPVAALRAANGMVAYARERVAASAREPSSELLAVLHQARRESSITEDEAVATWIMVAIAGHETSANLIGNAVLALLDHPAVLERARTPGASLGRLVDECLRYDDPVPYTVRTACEPATVGGVDVVPGGSVVAVMAAANRDPTVFPEPDRLDPGRPSSPSHVGFGTGIHACVGSVLARLETEIALGALVPRLAPDQARDGIVRRTSIAVRGLAHFPVGLDPAASGLPSHP